MFKGEALGLRAMYGEHRMPDNCKAVTLVWILTAAWGFGGKTA